MPPEPPSTIRFDDFEIDSHSLELRQGGTRVDLSPQGVRLLAFLVERRGDLVTREALYDLLWPQGEVDMDRGLNTLVRQVRIAIGDSATEPRFLRTYPRRGYRFLSPPPAAAGPPPPPELPASPVATPRRWRRLTAVLAFGVVGLVALRVVQQRAPAAGEWPGLPPAAREPLELGRYLLRRPHYAERLRAEEPLLTALEVAPGSRPVRAYLAEVRLLQGRFAEASALVGHDPDDPELTAHEAYVAGNLRLLAGDSAGLAERLLARAVALQPRNAGYRVGHAFLLAISGRGDSARAEVARASAGDPVGAAVSADAGLVLLYAGDMAGAARACETALAAEPAFEIAAECALAARRGLGHDDAAMGHAIRLVMMAGADSTAVLGAGGPAGERLGRFLAWRGARADPRANPYAAAVALAEAGRADDALAALELLATRPRGFAHLVVAVDPRLAELRHDPRFDGVLARLDAARGGR